MLEGLLQAYRTHHRFNMLLRGEPIGPAELLTLAWLTQNPTASTTDVLHLLEVENDIDTLELNLPRKSGRLKAGDILVHLKTLPLRASVATQRDVGSIAGTNIAVLTRLEDLNDPEEQFDPYYLAGILRTRYMNRVLTSRLGGESVSSLSLRTLRTLPVPLPPPEVQEAMARAFMNLEKYARLTEDLVEARGKQLEIALDTYFSDTHGH